jgi:hypothetical protein
VDNSISVDRGGLRNGIQMSTVWYWSKSRWFGRCFGPKKVDEKKYLAKFNETFSYNEKIGFKMSFEKCGFRFFWGEKWVFIYYSENKIGENFRK